MIILEVWLDGAEWMEQFYGNLCVQTPALSRIIHSINPTQLVTLMTQTYYLCISRHIVSDSVIVKKTLN
jgi:hypothetical protein